MSHVVGQVVTLPGPGGVTPSTAESPDAGGRVGERAGLMGHSSPDLDPAKPQIRAQQQYSPDF